VGHDQELLYLPVPIGQRQIVLNSYELLNEVSDDTRFKKVVAGSLNEVRRAAGDGLFT
jgi:cytochrome P450/NADPH-cytochrome P450 reductase